MNNNTFEKLLRQTYTETVSYGIEDFINAEINEEDYEPVFENRDDVIESCWNCFVKDNPKEARFFGKDCAVALFRFWLSEEKEEEVRGIVKNY